MTTKIASPTFKRESRGCVGTHVNRSESASLCGVRNVLDAERGAYAPGRVYALARRPDDDGGDGDAHAHRVHVCDCGVLLHDGRILEPMRPQQ